MKTIPLIVAEYANQVFNAHAQYADGITYRVPEIQRLAMAISLQGRHAVSVDYYGDAHQLRVYVRDPEIGTENRQGLARQHCLYQVALPHCGSSMTARNEACQALEAITHTLRGLLMEGQPS